MRIALAHNLRRSDSELEAELLPQEDVDRIAEAIETLGHEVIPTELSCPPEEIVDKLIGSRCDLIFNVAEGTENLGQGREALYPSIYEQLRLPYTGSNPALLYIDLDKRLSEKIMEAQGIRVPRGVFIDSVDDERIDDLTYPLMIKPNFEGSSKGITEDSICENPERAREVIEKLLREYQEGLVAEEFIVGRELSVPMLESWPGGIIEIVENTFDGNKKYQIYDYDLKQKDGANKVNTICPPEMSSEERGNVLKLAESVFRSMPSRDIGRVDIRLKEDGTAVFLELNPLPSLHPHGSLMKAAASKNLEFVDVIKLIIQSAARRYALPIAPQPRVVSPLKRSEPTARELGICVGRFPTGRWNAITDVEGVLVGHVTTIKDGVPDPREENETTCVRTGITAIVPESKDLFNNHMVAGGFVLNGIGEMSGLVQAMEWGWLETPLLLTNTMSVGRVHAGIIQYMIDKHPELGKKIDVIIPLVGETNDAFLNDVRIPVNDTEKAMQAIANAKDGPVEQGSVGGGTGMITFDFAGGIGTSSRKLPEHFGGYTVGVLVQSNFGKMRNLTIDGAVVGRELDPLYPYDTRRGKNYGSIITIIATDAPLLSSQLGRVSKRAALGLGRAGSWAASTSGEIVFAFSTANRASREAKGSSRELGLNFVTDEYINPIYESVVEATEEAVLNAIFCSKGMTGREGRYSPPVPSDVVLDTLSRCRTLGDCRKPEPVSMAEE